MSKMEVEKGIYQLSPVQTDASKVGGVGSIF